MWAFEGVHLIGAKSAYFANQANVILCLVQEIERMEEQKLKSKFPGAPGVFFGYWVQDYFNLSNNQEGGIQNLKYLTLNRSGR